MVTVLLPSVEYSACLWRERLRNIATLNAERHLCLSFNRKIRTRWRAEQDQEHENIKSSKINFFGGSSRCNRSFRARSIWRRAGGRAATETACRGAHPDS
jgi:hypothetical protein